MPTRDSDGRILLSKRTKEQNLRERDAALYESKPVLALRRGIKAKFGFDPMSKDAEEIKKFPVREASFSWESVYSKLVEADSASSFPQLLRSGVQNIANNAYETVETTHGDWTTTIQSKLKTELYAPLHGVGFPSEVGEQEAYPEVGAAGLDISITNRKMGSLLGFSYELGEDDQTGQYQQQAALMGEYMAQVVDVLCYAKVASVSNMVYSNYRPQATETKPQDEVNGYPWATSASPFVGGGWNKPASFAVLTQTALQAAKTQLNNQKNKLGLKMSVSARRLIVGPQDEFNAAIILNSSFYPSVPSGTAGAVGGAFSINPIKGIADLTVARFLFKNDGTCNGDTRAWYLADDTKPFFVVQLREANSIVQENPESGESFTRDVIRFKARMRGNADFIDPRFIFQGNDGSVTS